MSATNLIGPILTRGQIENAILAHVKANIETYLATVEDQAGKAPGQIARPKSYDVVDEFQRYPEESMPFVAVVSPGLDSGKPIQMDGDGVVTAWWQVAIGAIVTTPTMRSSKDLSGYYGAAIRGLVMQMPSFGDFALATDWLDERYDDFPRVQERSIAAVRLVFAVKISDVLNAFQAPRSLNGNGNGNTDYPTITDVEVEVDLEQ